MKQKNDRHLGISDQSQPKSQSQAGCEIQKGCLVVDDGDEEINDLTHLIHPVNRLLAGNGRAAPDNAKTHKGTVGSEGLLKIGKEMSSEKTRMGRVTIGNENRQMYIIKTWFILVDCWFLDRIEPLNGSFSFSFLVH